MTARLLFVHALSPLHAGTGQGVGAIDLPVARERASGLPTLPGSSLKGPLRDRASSQQIAGCKAVFGPDTTAAADHAGAVLFGDARLLLLPVRSLAGGFAWATSPYVLARLRRDAADANDTTAPAAVSPSFAGAASVAEAATLGVNGKLILEDLDLDLTEDQAVGAWADWLGKRLFPDRGTNPDPDANFWRLALRGRLCVLHDTLFAHLLRTATELRARVRIDPETRTAADKALWYEEALPEETVLYSLLLESPTNESRSLATSPLDVVAGLTGEAIQLGGKATVGRGLCRLRLAPAGGTP